MQLFIISISPCSLDAVLTAVGPVSPLRRLTVDLILLMVDKSLLAVRPEPTTEDGAAFVVV